MSENLHVNARNFLNPVTLSNHLIKINDKIIVDKRFLKNTDLSSAFIIILKDDYGWNYCDFDSIELCFEVRNGEVYGGIYNKKTGKESVRLIASTKPYISNRRVYRYSKEVIENIIHKILSL